MQKRGQIYILAALIILAVIFSLSSVVNKVKQEKIESDFSKLSENYFDESSKFINSLLNVDEDILDSYSNFTVLFTAYSKARNPDFSLIYAIEFNDTIKIGNYLNYQIAIDNGTDNYDIHVLEGCYDNVDAAVSFSGLSLGIEGIKVSDVKDCEIEMPFIDKLWIQIGSYWYLFNLIKGKPDLVIVSREEAKEQRQVFVGSEGFIKEDRDKAGKGSEICNELYLQGDCPEDICILIGNCNVSCVNYYGSNKEGCLNDNCVWNEVLGSCENE